MLRILFLIIALFLNQSPISETLAAAPNSLEEVKIPSNKIQSIEEISADLKAKKIADEPFNQKHVKVDLESLGLDPIDNKKAKNQTVIIDDLPKIVPIESAKNAAPSAPAKLGVI